MLSRVVSWLFPTDLDHPPHKRQRPEPEDDARSILRNSNGAHDESVRRRNREARRASTAAPEDTGLAPAFDAPFDFSRASARGPVVTRRTGRRRAVSFVLDPADSLLEISAVLPEGDASSSSLGPGSSSSDRLRGAAAYTRGADPTAAWHRPFRPSQRRTAGLEPLSPITGAAAMEAAMEAADGITALSRDATLVLSAPTLPPRGSAPSPAHRRRPTSFTHVCGVSGFERPATAADDELDRLAALDDDASAVGGLILTAAVQQLCLEAARDNVGQLHAVVDLVLRDAVRSVCDERCPKPRGVLRAISSGRAFRVPVELDDIDRDGLAQLRGAPAGKTVLTEFDYSITAGQLRTVLGTSWLNDQVINYYCRLVQEQLPESRTVTLGAHFFTVVAKACATTGNFEQARRWTTNVDVFWPRKLLIVVNEASHWTLAVLNNEAQRLEYYDSFGSDGAAVMDRLCRVLDEEYADKRELLALKARDDAGELPEGAINRRTRKRMAAKCAAPLPATPVSQWTRHSPCHREQDNPYDCGVYTAQYCLCAALDKDPTATVKQAHMPFYRELMALELANERILARR